LGQTSGILQYDFWLRKEYQHLKFPPPHMHTCKLIFLNCSNFELPQDLTYYYGNSTERTRVNYFQCCFQEMQRN
jgi:hypothetical protein